MHLKNNITFPIQDLTGKENENLITLDFNNSMTSIVKSEYKIILQQILKFEKKNIFKNPNQLILYQYYILLKKLYNYNTKNYIIHRAFITQRHNKRYGTANTKTRAEVRGGGKKPWRQKGTGRARAGSNRSPLWKGGGVSFGPKPKIYFNKINRKEWRLGLRNLLLGKKNNIIIINDFENISNKTNNILKQLKILNINLNEETLLIVPKIEKNLFKAINNIKTINITLAENLNIKQLLTTKHLIITVKSLKLIEETYND
ncbi:unnamed protein product [Choristocarpus tenellus]|uniref:50S ribosomal protein L4 n=1 Tax=Choristocarpus tenellus TaxID=116065 RepID=UPI002E786BEB|nr:50S ribosomal protein L4 [Choristocarpus tenellus]WAM62332.1 50S ribosomal protein L4 [Choristocarpus tenellus]